MHVLCTSVFLLNQVAYHVADHYYIVSKHTPHALTQLQHRFGSPAPFVPVVVRTVMRKHHLHAQHLGVWHQQSRPYGVYVQYVCPQFLRLVYGSVRMYNGFKRLLFRCLNVHQLYAFPFFQAVADVAFTPYHRYVFAHGCNSRKQFLTVRLHSAHDIRDATGTGNNNFHKIFRIKNKSLLLPRHKQKSMSKFFLNIKESAQHAGIILLSCLSALWLLIRGKRIK